MKHILETTGDTYNNISTLYHILFIDEGILSSCLAPLHQHKVHNRVFSIRMKQDEVTVYLLIIMTLSAPY